MKTPLIQFSSASIFKFEKFLLDFFESFTGLESFTGYLYGTITAGHVDKNCEKTVKKISLSPLLSVPINELDRIKTEMLCCTLNENTALRAHTIQVLPVATNTQQVFPLYLSSCFKTRNRRISAFSSRTTAVSKE